MQSRHRLLCRYSQMEFSRSISQKNIIVQFMEEVKMADTLLIVHGYSDGSSSFTALGDFLKEHDCYKADKIFYLNYSSMDDEADFLDFADKLDADFRSRFMGQRIDVVCHSTGSLVVRAWLALHAKRNRLRGTTEDCPVDRMFCFAPANFGSDLAGLGQSFLGKFRSTFFNSHSNKKDFLESGKQVLRGLEPASPFQWRLSFEHDLHGEDSYFNPKRPAEQRCYPFVFAAANAYGGLEGALVKQRSLPGTDGTVRISGTSLNTRACTLDFRQSGPELSWWVDEKYSNIPFAMFAGFNHGSLIDPDTPLFTGHHGPGTLLLETIRRYPRNLAEYEALAQTFDAISELNLGELEDERKDLYQQFFFRVRDDVDNLVDDFVIDFHVINKKDGSFNADLTEKFDADFKSEIYIHSASRAHRIFKVNCKNLAAFDDELTATDAKLMLEIQGSSGLPDVRYEVSTFVAYDPEAALPIGTPDLLYPNTTTMVDVVLNRIQSDALLVVGVAGASGEDAERRNKATGRASAL
jgi:pimeloyl-ACP methyl ester carboxylesterase